MDGDKTHRPGRRSPANDNAPVPGEEEGGEALAPWQKLDRVVLDIARLIGRQMAREDFERLRAAAANDNAPPSAGEGEGGASED